MSERPPTRSLLIQLRRELSEARRGQVILDRKREVLLRELWGLLAEVERNEKTVRERFQGAYRALDAARLAMGRERVRWAGLAPAAQSHLDIELRNLMGVELPVVRLDFEPLPLPYSPWGISPAFDEARQRWLEVGQMMGGWAEAVGAVRRIAAELDRTRRRVNALEHLLIPNLEQTISRIEAALEEEEREVFIRAKRFKEVAHE